MQIIRTLAFTVITLILLTMPAMAGVDMYIKLPDIDGESKAMAPAYGSVGVESFALQPDENGRLPQSGAGMADITLKRGQVGMLQAGMQGKSFDEIVIYVRKDSGDSTGNYIKYTLTNCIISSPQTSAAAANLRAVGQNQTATISANRSEPVSRAADAPVEEITISFRRITIDA